MAELDAIWADLQAGMERELGLRIIGWLPIAGGTQNRLFRLEVDDGPPLLAKAYHRDRWPRLEREFGVLTWLGHKGVHGVPRALLRSDEHQYAVYSFEAGRARAAAELSLEDVRRIAALAADLHANGPGSDDALPGADQVDVQPAADAAFSPAQQIEVLHSRLGAFEEFARSAAADDEVRQFAAEIDLRGRLEELIGRVMSGVDSAGDLERGEWRVNSGDFGPQNLLFSDDGQVTAVDWEAGGWDDPARLAMGFVAHATSEELSEDARHCFLAEYADKRALSESDMRRFETVGALLDLEWVAIYASAMTPEVVAGKQFANAKFDRHAYLSHVISLVKRRLERATEGRGYRF